MTTVTALILVAALAAAQDRAGPPDRAFEGEGGGRTWSVTASLARRSANRRSSAPPTILSAGAAFVQPEA